MRWIERVSGLLAGLLAIAAGALASQLPAVRTLGNSTTYGSVSAGLHSAITLPVAISVVAALVIATVAFLDARRPARSRAMTALILIATATCAVGASVLLGGNVALVYAPSPASSGLFVQYNAGALFIPALAAALVCVIAAIWPRRPAPAVQASR